MTELIHFNGYLKKGKGGSIGRTYNVYIFVMQLRWLMWLICEYRVISRSLHLLKPTPFSLTLTVFLGHH